MICTLGHCLWTRHRPAARVVAKASHRNRFHWLWLLDRPISNQCSPILTRWQRLIERHSYKKKTFCCDVFSSLLQRMHTLGYYVNLSVWLMWIDFISERNEDSVFWQLFWAAKSCIINSFSQIFSRSLQVQIAVKKMIHTTADSAAGRVELWICDDLLSI